MPGGQIWLANVVAAVLFSGFAAYLSWIFIEKRVLNLRATGLAFVHRTELLRASVTADR